MNTQQVSLSQTVDAVVIGAGTAAVHAALALRAEGKQVYVISDRAYFGDESAGALESEGKQLNQPGAAKHALELSLIEAGIDFLFLSRAVAISPVRTGAGMGRFNLIIASRTSLIAIRATQLLDATLEGQLLSLPGIQQWGVRAPRSLTQKSAGVGLIADRNQSVSFEGVALEEIGEPVQFKNRIQRDRVEVVALRGTTEAIGRGRTPEAAGLEGRVRARFWHPGIELSADVLRWNWATGGDESLLDNPLALPASAYSLHPQLWICGPELPLSSAGLEKLYDPVVMASLGERVGKAMAAESAAAGEIEIAPASEAQPQNLRFAPAFLRGAEDELHLTLPEWPLLPEVDVIVAGGGTGGAPAAIAAAREGKRVLLLEQQRMLGGVGTAGTIASYWFGNKVGFTAEVDQALHAIDPLYTDAERKRRLTQWNTELKAAWYLRELHKAGGEAWLGSFAFGVQMKGDSVVGLLVSTPFGSGLVPCGSVVDASGNADIAAAAGAPCRVVDALHSAVQGAGLSPRYPGRHYVNTDFTFIDDADPRGVTYAFVHARAKFREEFDTITFLNTRERRQIIGRVELSPLDFLAGRTFPDVINVAQSNFDTHGFTIHPVFAVVAPDHAPLSANVPLRCLMPQEISGVIVIGLGMSAHRDSLPVIRMQADVQNQGYAAGLAAAMASECGGDFDAVGVRALQQKLVDAKALPAEALEWQDSFPLPAETVATAVQETPLTLFAAAIILAHPEQSIPLLRDTLHCAASSEKSQSPELAALMLGMMGDASAAPALAELISQRDWDEGWDYRGMGQFGLSASRVDSLIMALGRTRSIEAIPVLQQKVEALDSSAAFSHCRALAIAAAHLGSTELAAALHHLLELPGVQGHIISNFGDGVATANEDPVETASRNLSLRELYLAKGLYLCGDHEGLGRRILEGYRHDLRGPYARHATAILSEPNLDALRGGSI